MNISYTNPRKVRHTLGKLSAPLPPKISPVSAESEWRTTGIKPHSHARCVPSNVRVWTWQAGPLVGASHAAKIAEQGTSWPHLAILIHRDDPVSRIPSGRGNGLKLTLQNKKQNRIQRKTGLITWLKQNYSLFITALTQLQKNCKLFFKNKNKFTFFSWPFSVCLNENSSWNFGSIYSSQSFLYIC